MNGRTASRDWRWYIAAFAGALAAAHVLWVLTSPAGDALQPWFANLLIDASHALATVLVFAVALRYRGSRVGLGWSLVGLGLMFGQFGDSSWSFQELVLHREVPFPSISDIGYAGAYVPVFIGLLVMPVSPVTGSGRLKLTLDAVILMSALAVISWHLIVSDVIAQSDASPLATGLSVFYPLADLGIIFAAFMLVARAGRSLPGLAFGLLGAGYALTAFSDSLFTYLSQAGYETGNVIDIGWVAGNTLISLAALVRLGPPGSLGRSTPASEAAPSFWPSVLTCLPIIPLSVVLLQDDRSSSFLTGGVLVVIGLVVSRQVLALYENVRLNRELAALSVMLETKVKVQTMEMLRRGRRGEVTPLPPGERPNGADEPVGGLGPFHGG